MDTLMPESINMRDNGLRHSHLPPPSLIFLRLLSSSTAFSHLPPPPLIILHHLSSSSASSHLPPTPLSITLGLSNQNLKRRSSLQEFVVHIRSSSVFPLS